MLKNFPSDKSKPYKKCTLFSFAVPTHHSFTFNSRSLYELSKSMWDFTFSIPFLFIKVYFFVQQIAWTLDFKTS